MLRIIGSTVGAIIASAPVALIVAYTFDSNRAGWITLVVVADSLFAKFIRDTRY